MPATAAAGPVDRARVAGAIFDVAREGGVWSAGYASTGHAGIAIANSAGVRAAYDATTAACNVKLSAADASGYAECFTADVGEIDGRTLAAVAAQKARGSAAPQGVAPGEWTVILEPAAFGELMSYLLGHFSARAYDEGSSFLSTGLGKRYAGENVTLTDDAHHPLHAGQPFDYEAPRRSASRSSTAAPETRSSPIRAGRQSSAARTPVTRFRPPTARVRRPCTRGGRGDEEHRTADRRDAARAADHAVLVHPAGRRPADARDRDDA